MLGLKCLWDLCTLCNDGAKTGYAEHTACSLLPNVGYPFLSNEHKKKIGMFVRDKNCLNDFLVKNESVVRRYTICWFS